MDREVVGGDDGAGQAVAWLRGLADPVRLRLLALLGAGGEVCVCYLHDSLGLPQPTVSRHLAALRARGLVATRRAGLWIYYRLAEPPEAWRRAVLAAALEGVAEADPFRGDRDRLDRLRLAAREPGRLREPSPPGACC